MIGTGSEQQATSSSVSSISLEPKKKTATGGSAKKNKHGSTTSKDKVTSNGPKTPKPKRTKKKGDSLTSSMDVRTEDMNAHATPLVLPEEIELKDSIGEGACGKVWKGTLRGSTVAVKELKAQFKYENAEQFKGEVYIMTQLRHPNVILFMGACHDPPYIVTEYLEGGDLQAWIKKNKKLVVSKNQPPPIKEMLQISLDVARGMAWLHGLKPQPIIHKDLKPSNIMLDEKQRAKIIDFGLSEVQKQKEMENKFGGSACWMSPEILTGAPYTEKIDVYAYGIILWQIFALSPDVYDVSVYKASSNQASFNLFVHDIVDNKKRPNIPPHVRTNHESVADIIEKAWDADPNLRLPFTDIIQNLNSALLSSILKDNDAIQMWKNYFQDKEVVPLNDFYEAIWYTLYKQPNPKKEIEYKCLDAVVKNFSQVVETINLERFGYLLHWYGPLFPVNNKWSNMAQKIVKMLEQDWYHGEITGNEAEESLQRVKEDNGKGEFLIRCSTNLTAPFTMSRFEGHGNARQIVHHRISFNKTTHVYKMAFQTKKTEEMKEVSAETLEDFVKEAKVYLNMKKPIKCRKFKPLFVSNQDVAPEGSATLYKVAHQ